MDDLELTQAERDAILASRAATIRAAEAEAEAAAARAAEIALLTAHAHVVGHEPTRIAGRTKGADGEWREAAYADALIACPDCTRGLQAARTADPPLRICSRLEGLADLPPGLYWTAHDVLACGLGVDGVPIREG